MSNPNSTEALPVKAQLADAIGGQHDPNAIEEDNDGR